MVCMVPPKAKVILDDETGEEKETERTWIVEGILSDDEKYAVFELSDAIPESYKENKETLVG